MAGKRENIFDLEKTRADVKRAAELDAKENDNDVFNLMSSESGRRFMYWLLGRCGVFRTSFSTNALVMAFNEGQRNIGLMLQAKVLEIEPGLYERMIKENKEHHGDN